jgi:hypothetical protein
VYCSVFLLFSLCINHFICYSRIVYIGDSLGHMICLLIYFQLAAIVHWSKWHNGGPNILWHFFFMKKRHQISIYKQFSD